MPDRDEYAFDEQDQSETFDETHLDDEGDGDLLLDEADPVLDVTQAEGDADDETYDEDDLELEDVQALDGVEDEADPLDDVDEDETYSIEGEEGEVRANDEVELVYTGLMRYIKGAQASAAHWEAKRLADDDIDDLGYGEDKTQ